jgi:hypothetical protein
MINKNKILAGVRACISPRISNCQECPYWENGRKNCEELRMDICEAVHTALTLINVQQLEYEKLQAKQKKVPPQNMWWERGDE